MSQKEISVLIGSGAIGLAVITEISDSRDILLADLQKETAQQSARELVGHGHQAHAAQVDITSRVSLEELRDYALQIGEISQLVIATGVSPSVAPPRLIFNVDLLGVALALDVFGEVIKPGGAGLVIGSQAGHRLPALTAEQDELIANTPADELLNLSIFNTREAEESLFAYQLAKRGSSLRVKGEAVKWGKRGARVNAISPGIVMTPLSEAELKSDNAAQYQRMIAECPAKRVGSPEEIAALAKVIMGENGGFITGSDFLIDGGVTAAYLYGDLVSLK